MPSTRPTVDPVLDILEEMGYDFDELDGDGYKRSIKEAMIKSHPDKGGDPKRFMILNEEWKKLRTGGSRPAEVKEKKTTIKGAKLLPGRGNFKSDDLKDNNGAEMGDSDKKNKFVDFLNSEVKSRLDNINSTLGNILRSLEERERVAEARDDDMREAINASKKSSREDKLEGKKGFKDKLKDKVMGQVEKTAGNFFMKVLKFALFTWLGSSLSRLITLIKDPAVLLDPIKKFFNAFIGFQNFIMKAMWSITGKPINDIIKGIETGANFVIDSINKATSLLFIPPIPSVKLPKIPGPFQIPLIPLSKTAQGAASGGIDTKGTPLQGASGGGVLGMDGVDGVDGLDGLDAVQGIHGPSRQEMEGKEMEPSERFGAEDLVQQMSGGGTVDAKNISAAGGGKVESNSGIKIKGMGSDTQLLAAQPGESILQPGVREKVFRDTGKDVLAYNKGPNANNPTVSSTNNITAASTGGIVNNRTTLFPKITKMNVGGLVPAPYPEGDNILNSFPMVMGYRGGGDVVNAKLTPGEIVMNKEQQKKMFQKTGVDPASFVPPAQPGKVKFASGGVATDIPTPPRRNPIMIDRQKKTPRLGGSTGSSGGGDTVPNISSIDPHNMIIPVIKSIYNIMG